MQAALATAVAVPAVKSGRVDSAAGRWCAKGQQPSPALPRKAAAIHAGRYAPDHGGPRERAARNGIGAIAAVGT
jgi:hypothetical protein